MFVSLFGSGMNFTGVSVHPFGHAFDACRQFASDCGHDAGLLIPFVGGVLIDRIDRRYLGILLDFVRGLAVLGTAYIAWRGHLQLWHLYAMTLVTGMGFAMTGRR